MDRELPMSPWPEWNIIGKAGEGAYGRVYKAERTVKGHSFYSAIKIITIPESREELNSVLAETGSEEDARRYFENVMEECLREISTMENFRGNSYVVAVEDYKVTEYLDEIGWDIYIRMEFLESFQEYLTENSFDEEKTVKLGCDLCRALVYCSRLHIIHRDIKPENIFVSRFGDFKLGDFGIAREIEKTIGGLSKKGTSSYMAPEMYHGEPCTNQVDIYALGLVMYRLTNRNRLPFISLDKQLITYKDKENALVRRMSGEALPPGVDAGEDLSYVILKACAYSPAERYRTPGEMLSDLEKVQQRILTGKAAEIIPEPSRKEEEAPEKDPAAPGASDGDQDKKQKENGTSSRFRQALPWAAAFLAVIVLVGAGVGYFLKRMVEDTVREQTERMISSIQDRSEVSEETASLDFATSIDLISERVTTIVEELPGYDTIGTEGERVKYYDEDGQLRKVMVYPALSEEGVNEEYYYWNGSLFFAYIWKGDEEELYYYRDGMLIRWIDKDGTVHDEEYDDPEYEERGDKYWRRSIVQMET